MSPSPSSSVEATHSPTSPFLHNLSQRLRKGSTASRTSSLGSDPVQQSQSQTQSQGHVESSDPVQDAKSAKRLLLSIIKDDWDYPAPPATKELKTDRPATSYRHRDESVSEYESSSEQKRKSQDTEAYKFDSPDDVGVSIQRRKARKRRLLEQEMTWNEGLRIWTLRRDAWVGAVSNIPNRPSESAVHRKRPSLLSKHRNSSETTPRSSVSTPSWPLPNSGTQNADHTHGSAPQESSPSEPALDSEPDAGGPYLPIYPPLLPASNTLRSRIQPTAYPTIYSKVVLQSLSPNVPIPLHHMIGALVDGWKAEGNWPPQTTIDPNARSGSSLLGRRKGHRKPETAFQKWKREQDEKAKAARRIANGLEKEDTSGHKGVRKSISGVVKKAFGMEGVDEDRVEHDLEKLGLTFETDEEMESQALEVLKNGHV